MRNYKLFLKKKIVKKRQVTPFEYFLKKEILSKTYSITGKVLYALESAIEVFTGQRKLLNLTFGEYFFRVAM